MVVSLEDVFILRPPVEPDKSPGKVIVHRRLGARRHHQGRKREAAIRGAVEQPGANAAAHATFWRRLLVLLRQPRLVRQQFGKVGPNGRDDRARLLTTRLDLAHLGDKRAQGRVINHVLVLHFNRCSHRNPLS